MCPSSRRRSGSWPFFFWSCCLSPSPGGSVCFGGLFYLWWRLPPRLVSLGGPLLGPTAVSSGLQGGGGGGVMRRAIPSPGPLWRGLRISAWLHHSQGFRLSSIMSYRLLLSYRFTLSFGPSSAPFGCLPLAGLFTFLGPCGVSSPSTFLIVRIAPFDYPLACQDGSLLCGLSDGLPY